MTREEIVTAVQKERLRQDEKWGWPQRNSLAEWMTILMEEVGELAQEVLRVRFANKSTNDLQDEAIQCMAVCSAMLETLDMDQLKEYK